ncbi:MAG: polyvinyl alcohol dehydrogenase [Pirellulaceae bacterium]|nr:MAG: polyvinyl alcohol dehydrogenase [Pirellulaceae bacterium]
MRRVLVVACFCLSVAAMGRCVRADEGAKTWPTFRGPDRTAVAEGEQLADQWPQDGPPLVWEATGIGRGYSSVALDQQRALTMGDTLPEESTTDEFLICLDRSTGKLLWKARTGPAWNEGRESWQSARSTPTIDGDNVYAMTAFGELICFTNQGEEVWRRHLMEDLNGKKADSWGYSESPTIDGDRLICTPGGPENTMVALDKRTGELIWSCQRPEDRGAGHASIVKVSVAGTEVYVQTTGSGAMGVRASDGKLLWTYDIPKTTAVIPTPIVHGDLVFFTAGYGLGGALLRQIPRDQGDIAIEEIYPNKQDLQNKHGGVVRLGDYIYGDTDARGIPFCAKLLTGEVVWKGRGSGRESASVVAADGKLFLHYADGTMSIAKASPEAFEELSAFKVPGTGNRPSWAHPVVLDGKLYLREDNRVLCYDVSR